MTSSTKTSALELAMLEALFDTGLLGVALLDEQLCVLRVNPRMVEIGQLPATVPSTTVLAEVAPAFADLITPILRRVLDTGEPLSDTLEQLRTSGSGGRRRLDVSCRLVRSEAGRGLLLQIDDVTERWAAEARLRANEALLSSSEALAGLGSWELDVRTGVSRWSDQLCRMLEVPVGVSTKDLAAIYERFVHPADRQLVDTTIKRVIEQRVPYLQYENRATTATGRELVLETRIRTEQEGGRVARLSGSVLDITQRRRAEQRLQEQQNFLDAIVDNIPNMIFVKEAKGLRFVRFNRAGEELIGYGREQLLGKTDYDFFPAIEADKFTAQDRTVFATGRVLECPEDRIHTREKGVRILQSKKVPILDEQGEPAYLLGISEDVTERKRTETFRLSDLLVRSIEDYAVFLLDVEGRVKTWNAGAERVTGYGADEIIGKSIGALRAQHEDEEERGLLAKAASQGHVVDEGPWLCKDGRRIWRVTTVTAIRDDEGEVILYGTVTRDITERKRAEDERELLLTRLREALRLRDEFLSVASHELRTPVTTLKLQAELLQHLAQAPAEQLASMLPALIEKLRRQTDRLEDHVDRLLDVSRLTSGKVQLQLADEDLGALTESVVARMRDEQRGRVTISLKTTPGVIGHWDALRVDQVVTNLLSNAVKYGAGLPIEVVVKDEGGEAVIHVQDQGIGIAPTDQSRIFEQFERAVSERNYGGLGLGLFIVRQLVEAMGGRIEVRSQAGAGATFVVRLPYGRRGEDPGHR